MEHKGFGTRIRFYGKRALCTRPEFKSERYAYEVMTPSAAIGMLESIYWHPGLKYVIDRIYVMNPIRFMSIKKNEVDSKGSIAEFKKMMEGGSVPAYIAKDHISQRSSTILVDVDYIVECHFVITLEANKSDNPGKFAEILRRRAEKGQCFSQPYFGARDYSADFELVSDTEKIEPCDITKDLGVMLHSMDFSDSKNVRPRFFMASLEHGIMQVSCKEVHE